MPGAMELGAQGAHLGTNVWAISKKNVDFAHPIFGPYFMICAPNLKLLPPPLNNFS